VGRVTFVAYIFVMGSVAPYGDAMGIMFQPFERKGYHVYHDNNYSSVQITEAILYKNVKAV
jgi:hypothetical protein